MSRPVQLKSAVAAVGNVASGARPPVHPAYRHAASGTSAKAKWEFFWALVADPNLGSTSKLIAAVLLLRFLNLETGQCNPSVPTIAGSIGMCERTVQEAIKELKSSGRIIVRGTKGGSKSNTKHYEFPLLRTGEAFCTGEPHCTGSGEEELRTGEMDCTEGAKPAADENLLNHLELLNSN